MNERIDFLLFLLNRYQLNEDTLNKLADELMKDLKRACLFQR